ncbi:universal stress protein [Actinoalloteichus sp. AHMU CJ021]|uniref:universal stress protein n=1 Tax=Actinoalloteichus sp. AHMU CJ021 TaxID=2072503 RepID=UPI0026BA1609
MTAYLNRATEVATEVAPNVDIRPETRMEGPVPALIELSRQARLIVLGSRGRGGFSSLLVGSAATGLAAHGHSPVAVIRGRTPTGPPPETGPIVVGVDGSPTSERAIAFAFDEAAFRDADLLAVHTWVDAAFESDFELTRNMVDWQAVEATEERVLAERLAGWQERYPDVRVRRIVVRDRPAPGLLSQAERARMIIVGSRGRGGFTGMLLGSTSRTLLHHASCPVIIARPEDQSSRRASSRTKNGLPPVRPRTAAAVAASTGRPVIELTNPDTSSRSSPPRATRTGSARATCPRNVVRGGGGSVVR